MPVPSRPQSRRRRFRRRCRALPLVFLALADLRLAPRSGSAERARPPGRTPHSLKVTCSQALVPSFTSSDHLPQTMLGFLNEPCLFSPFDAINTQKAILENFYWTSRQNISKLILKFRKQSLILTCMLIGPLHTHDHHTHHSNS